MRRDPSNVFINVPFDERYEPLFEALVFTITACGYRVNCALEDDDSGNVRMEKLERMIRSSAKSMHDLSRIEIGQNELPRFNMPFELGLAIGAKLYGVRRKDDKIKIMVAEPYKLPAYLSDLGGNDPSAHHNEPEKLIKIVRDFLYTDPLGVVLPGPKHLIDAFCAFKVTLPQIAATIDHQHDEINCFASYRQFLWCVSEFLRTKADT